MTESSMPWTSGVGDGGPYSQDTLRLWGKVLGKADSANLGVIPGMLNGLVPTSSGINNVTADTGYAVVDGTLYESTASVPITVASPAATTGARLVLRKTWSTRQVRLVAFKNTDGNTAIPALVQIDGTTWDIPIATFTITSGGVIGALTDVREFTRESTINVGFGDGATVITTGTKYAAQFQVPFACWLISWSITGDPSGSVVIDWWKDTYANWPPVVGDSIVASDDTKLVTAVKNQNLNPSTWTRAWDKGDFIVPNVDSASVVKAVNVSFRVAVL